MSRSKARLLLWLIFIGYTSCLLYWMFLGFGRSARLAGPMAYNVVPFQTIGLYIRHFESFPIRTWSMNVLGNIGVFMPYLLPLLLRRLRNTPGFCCFSPVRW